MPPTRERIEIVTEDGVRLAADHLSPEGAAPGAGAVWIGHAFLANRRSLDRPAGAGFASEIAAAGLHAYAIDLRGHGESRLANGAAGWHYEELFRDFEAATRFVRDRHPGASVGAIGHSLVGHGLGAWLGTRERGAVPLDAIVTIGANVWIPSLEPERLRWLRKRAVIALMSGVTRVCGRLPARALRAGSEDAPAEFVEVFGRWARGDRWAAPDGTDYLAGLARIETPTLAIFGSGDGILCHPTCGELFHRRMTGAPVEMHVAGPREVGFDPGHMEMVTDARSRPLWRRIGAWLAAALPGRS